MKQKKEIDFADYMTLAELKRLEKAVEKTKISDLMYDEESKNK
jgi:hypothetical protein